MPHREKKGSKSVPCRSEKDSVLHRCPSQWARSEYVLKPSEYVPTTHTSSEPLAHTAVACRTPQSVCAHASPFQRWHTPPPAATTSSGRSAHRCVPAEGNSSSASPVGVHPGVSSNAVPFQCSATLGPTSHTSSAEVPDTPVRSSEVGASKRCHAPPFHRSTVPPSPTAHTSFEAAPHTARSRCVFGTGTRFHPEPPQCSATPWS